MTNVVVYDIASMIGCSLSAALMLDSEEVVGPKYYRYSWIKDNNNKFNPDNVFEILVHVDRNLSEQCGQFKSMQLLENEKLNSDGQVTFLDGYFEQYKYPIKLWSNWFGGVDHKNYTYPSYVDKLILCNSTPLDITFDYVMTSALKPIKNLESIDYSTDLWERDHVMTHGTDGLKIGNWHKNWYGLFHDKVKQNFTEGKLKYFFQLNRMHWEVFEKENMADVKFWGEEDIQSMINIFYTESNSDTSYMPRVMRNNPNHLELGRTWYKDVSIIEDYIEYKFSEEQKFHITKYGSHLDKKFDFFMDKWGNNLS